MGINLVLDVLSGACLSQPSFEHNKSEDQALWDVILSHVQQLEALYCLHLHSNLAIHPTTTVLHPRRLESLASPP